MPVCRHGGEPLPDLHTPDLLCDAHRAAFNAAELTRLDTFGASLGLAAKDVTPAALEAAAKFTACEWYEVDVAKVDAVKGDAKTELLAAVAAVAEDAK